MLTSGPITIVASPRDRAVVPDPTIHYRPDKIDGHTYHITATTPHPEDKPATE